MENNLNQSYRSNIRRRTRLWLNLTNNDQDQNQIAVYQQQKNKFFTQLFQVLNKQFSRQHKQFLINFVLGSPQNKSKSQLFNLFAKFKFKNSFMSQQEDLNPFSSIQPDIFNPSKENILNINYHQTKTNNFFNRYNSYTSETKKRKSLTPVHKQHKIIFKSKKILDLDRKLQNKYLNSIANKIFLKSPLYYQKPQKLKRKADFIRQNQKKQNFKRRIKTDSDQPSSDIPLNYLNGLIKTKNVDFYLSQRPLKTQSSLRYRY